MRLLAVFFKREISKDKQKPVQLNEVPQYFYDYRFLSLTSIFKLLQGKYLFWKTSSQISWTTLTKTLPNTFNKHFYLAFLISLCVFQTL